jgi:hypothetical protein
MPRSGLGIAPSIIAKRFGYSPATITWHRDQMPQQLKAAIVAAALKPKETDLDQLRIDESEGILGNLAHQRARLLMCQDEAMAAAAFVDVNRLSNRALDPTLIAHDVGLDHLDDWQATLIDEPPKRLLACCGREVGKSTAAAVCALNTVLYAAPATVVLISPSLRQSVELFRTFHAMWQALPGRPAAEYETLSRLELANGFRVVSLPGSEKTVRGLASVDLIVIDEAARVDDDLLAATRPMLAVSNGSLFALTTPTRR